MYFGKMSDEIIRYSRIKGYMFDPAKYLTLGDVRYNLGEKEIIMLESLLNSEYFDSLIPMVTNKYVTHNSYDEVNPIKTKLYNIKGDLGPSTNVVCNPTNPTDIKGFWKFVFPPTFKEITFAGHPHCTFAVIIDLIKEVKGEIKTEPELKIELLDEYEKYMGSYGDQVLDILLHEGKRNDVMKVKTKAISFNTLIMSDNYHLST